MTSCVREQVRPSVLTESLRPLSVEEINPVTSTQQATHTQTHKPAQYKQVNTNMALLTLLQWRTQYNGLMTEHST